MGTKDAFETVLSKATKEGKMKDNRRIPLLNELKDLDVVKQSELRDEEILAVVLYTGPMVKMSALIQTWPARSRKRCCATVRDLQRGPAQRCQRR
jgi:hypothetical protein